ncbi:MAG: spectinomycin phosphotransferase [Kribbellaceae bacterium]|jgi:spectinomycin phosphotransferase|nr:spectinomycin phosphotransferase [Kribbellaceae bacterium]
MLCCVEDKLGLWISEDFGIKLTSIEQVHHGADVAADVWRARTTCDDLYAVKWSGGGTDAGPRATAYLASKGVRGVPAPLQTRTGDLWSQREGKRLSLVPWISGSRAAETGLTASQWNSYGALLAEVHATAPPADLRQALPRLNPINARMPALTRTIERRLSTERPADAIEEELAAVWQECRKTITGVLDLAEELADQELGGDPVICHADPHLGNVLITAEQLSRNGTAAEVHLIDWDDVVLAPREQDLMFMLGGMGSLGPTTDTQLSAFFAGYGAIDLDPTRLTYYRCARALEEIALWAEQVLTGPDREESLAILQGVLGADGLAVQALG